MIDLDAIRARDAEDMLMMPMLETLAGSVDDAELRNTIDMLRDRRALLAYVDALVAERDSLKTAVAILQSGNRARLEFLEKCRGMTAMDEYVDCAETAIADLQRELLAIREHAAALESREVCTVAHENVETCGYCQRDALRAAAGKVTCWRCLNTGRDGQYESCPDCSDLRALLLKEKRQ